MAPAPRLFLRKAARADIAEAFQWYDARSTGLGFEFLRAVRVALAGIERAPEQYPLALDDIRKALVPRFPLRGVFRDPLAWPLCHRGDARAA